MKKKLSLFLTLVMALGSTNIVSAKDFTDTTNSWASEAIDRWSDNEVLGGYEDGSFKPQSNITRAEFLAILDKVMQYQTVVENTTADITGNEWYADSVLKNIAAGNIENTTGDINASEKLTRSEVAVMLCKALEIAPVEGNTTFVDDSSISTDAKGYVKALQDKGFVTGKTNNKFDGNASITRAEVASMLDKVIKSFYTEAGTYTNNTDGNVVINTKDVVLKDVVINGDLFVAAGVGEGDLTLDNVTVTGDIIVEGGGSHSVKLTKGSKAKKVKMHKNSKETVRLYVDETSEATTVVTDSTANVIVEGEGTIETVIAEGSNTVTIGENTTVETVEVVEGCTVTNNGEIGEVVIDVDAAETVVEGTGTVKVVNAKNEKARFDCKIEKLFIHNQNAKITVSELVKAILDALGKDMSDRVTFEKSTKNSEKETNKDNNKKNESDNDDRHHSSSPKLVNIKVAYTSSSAVTVRFNSNKNGTVNYEFLDNGVVDSSISVYDQTLRTGLNIKTLSGLDSNKKYTLKITIKVSDGSTKEYTKEVYGQNYVENTGFTVNYLGRNTETAYVRVVGVENATVYYLAEPKEDTEETTSGSAVTVDIAPEYVGTNGKSVTVPDGSNYVVLEVPVVDGVAYNVYVVVENGTSLTGVKTVNVEAATSDITVPELVNFEFAYVETTSVKYNYSMSEMARIYTVIATDTGKEAITDAKAIKELVLANNSTSDVKVSYNSAIKNSETTRSGLVADTNYTIYMVAEDYAGNISSVNVKEFKTLAE